MMSIAQHDVIAHMNISRAISLSWFITGSELLFMSVPTYMGWWIMITVPEAKYNLCYLINRELDLQSTAWLGTLNYNAHQKPFWADLINFVPLQTSTVQYTTQHMPACLPPPPHTQTHTESQQQCSRQLTAMPRWVLIFPRLMQRQMKGKQR